MDFHTDVAVNNFYEAIERGELDPIVTPVEPGHTRRLREFELRQNQPNPFNPYTIIEYTLPSKLQVEITISNLLGWDIRTLVSEVQSAGLRTVPWDGRDNGGEQSLPGFICSELKPAI